MTFGQGVADDDTHPAHLARVLRENAIDAGVECWGADYVHPNALAQELTANAVAARLMQRK